MIRLKLAIVEQKSPSLFTVLPDKRLKHFPFGFANYDGPRGFLIISQTLAVDPPWQRMQSVIIASGFMILIFHFSFK